MDDKVLLFYLQELFWNFKILVDARRALRTFLPTKYIIHNEATVLDFWPMCMVIIPFYLPNSE